MNLCFNFQSIDQAIPKDNEYCLIITRSQPGIIHSASYDASEPAFYITDDWSYPASEVTLWSKASF